MAADLTRVRKSIRAALDPSGRTAEERRSLTAKARQMAERHGLLSEFFPDKSDVFESVSRVTRAAEAELRESAAWARAHREMQHRTEHARQTRRHEAQLRALREMERRVRHRRASSGLLTWLLSCVAAETLLAIATVAALLQGASWSTLVACGVLGVAVFALHWPSMAKYAEQVRKLGVST